MQNNQMTPDMLEKAKAAANVEELLSLAKADDSPGSRMMIAD